MIFTIWAPTIISSTASFVHKGKYEWIQSICHFFFFCSREGLDDIVPDVNHLPRLKRVLKGRLPERSVLWGWVYIKRECIKITFYPRKILPALTAGTLANDEDELFKIFKIIFLKILYNFNMQRHFLYFNNTINTYT